MIAAYTVHGVHGGAEEIFEWAKAAGMVSWFSDLEFGYFKKAVEISSRAKAAGLVSPLALEELIMAEESDCSDSDSE